MCCFVVLIEICVLKTSKANYQLSLCLYHYYNLVNTRQFAAIIVGIIYCLGSGILWKGRKSYEEGIFLVLFVGLFLWARIDYCSEDFVFQWHIFFPCSLVSLREMRKIIFQFNKGWAFMCTGLLELQIRSLPSTLLQFSAVKDI